MSGRLLEPPALLDETMIRLTSPWLSAILLFAPVPLAAQEAGGESLFSVNLGLMAWTVVIFLVLLLVLWKFAWGPILGAVESREENIRDALDEAARRQEEARELAEEQRSRLQQARREAQEIISEGREAGQKVRREIEEDAREESQRMLERARREIGREKDAALDEIRRESVDLALAAASRLIQQKLDAEEDRELVLDYLDDLTGDGRTSEPVAKQETGAEA